MKKRLKKVKPLNTYITSAMTSGYDVYTRCDSHPDGCEVLVSDGRTSVGGTILKANYTVLDTSQVTVGTEFDVEYTRTFWNAFQNSDQNWVGIIARESVYKVSFLFILPDKEIFSNPRLMVAKIGSNKKYDYSGEKLFLGGLDKGWLYWEVLTPQSGHVYRVDWDWK